MVPPASGDTTAAVLADVGRRLAAVGVPTPAVDAELLVRHVTGWSRARMLVSADDRMPSDAGTALEELVARRAEREPLQLILGTVGFRRLELEVRPGVFVPRPETELLAGEAVIRVPAGGVVVEPCTGSGAVACAVADETDASLVVATDESAIALALAARNARRCGLEVHLGHGDLLAPVPRELAGAVDVLVANPPYVAEDEVAGLEPEVVDWDPREALVAGPTGHEVSDRLIAAAWRWLRPGGWLLLEVADLRAVETARRCAAAGLGDAGVLPDLAGRDRIVRARRP